MNRKMLSFAALISTAISLLSVSSCGHDRELVSISIQPATETFGASNIPVSDDAGLNVQLRALGTYIHPVVTDDITDQVVWASNDTQMVTVNSTGLLSAVGDSCGSSLVSATVTTNNSAGGLHSSGAIVTGYMTANVVCFTGSGGGSEPLLSVSFPGLGSGTITSSPLGLSCASTAVPCVGAFASGTPVNLTASPNGTFGGWLGCDSVDATGLICTVLLTSDRSLTATFN
jgi:hypothetical protein